jgi:hypothetical protein
MGHTMRLEGAWCSSGFFCNPCHAGSVARKSELWTDVLCVSYHASTDAHGDAIRAELNAKIVELTASYESRMKELHAELQSEREARQRLEKYLSALSRGEDVAPFDPAGPAVGSAVTEGSGTRSPRLSIKLVPSSETSPRGRSKSVTLSSSEVASALKPDPIVPNDGTDATPVASSDATANSSEASSTSTAAAGSLSPPSDTSARKERTKKRSLSFSLNPLKAIKSKSEKTLPKIKPAENNQAALEKEKEKKLKEEKKEEKKKKRSSDKDKDKESRNEKKQSATVIPPTNGVGGQPATGAADPSHPKGVSKMWRAFRNSFINKKTLGPNKKTSGGYVCRSCALSLANPLGR